MAPPRVLFVGNFLSGHRGSYAVCEALSARLRANGWQVLTTSARAGRLARLMDMVWTAAIRRRDYDVAHIDVFSGRAFTWAEAACAAVRATHKPIVLSLHGGALPEFSVAHPRRVRRLLAQAAAVTAPSRFLHEKLAPYCRDLRLHPNPIDAGRYGFRVRSRPAPRLLWLRAFHDVYNPSMAVDVLARLVPHCPRVSLTMVGPDKGDGSLQRVRDCAKRAGVLDRIDFAGGIPPAAVAGVLDAHDIFLNTSNTDNTPVSVIEALASGLVTVSTNAGGVPYLLTDGSDSLVVPVGDADAMAGAVRRALTNHELSRRLSLSARDTAARHDWSRVLPLWTNLFQSPLVRSHE